MKLNDKQKEVAEAVWCVPTMLLLFVIPPVGLLMFCAYIPGMWKEFKNLK